MTLDQAFQWWPAPAKVNLFLHITGRRADGYHLLQTVFQFLDFSDELGFALRADGRICGRYSLPGVDADADLILRAATLLRDKAGVRSGVDIDLRKRLPMGGGLGGGSSDAATTLVALNHLWKTRFNSTELAHLGLKLGADVPVFVAGFAAWAEGVGEKLEPVELPEPWYVVIVPPVQVPTALIFSDPDLTRNQPPIKIRSFLAGQAINVCEAVVRKRFPEVDRALNWLSQYGNARMSGTGCTVFAAFAEETTARDVYNKRPTGWGGFVARGLNRSPLQRCLEERTAGRS